MSTTRIALSAAETAVIHVDPDTASNTMLHRDVIRRANVGPRYLVTLPSVEAFIACMNDDTKNEDGSFNKQWLATPVQLAVVNYDSAQPFIKYLTDNRITTMHTLIYCYGRYEQAKAMTSEENRIYATKSPRTTTDFMMRMTPVTELFGAPNNVFGTRDECSARWAAIHARNPIGWTSPTASMTFVDLNARDHASEWTFVVNKLVDTSDKLIEAKQVTSIVRVQNPAVWTAYATKSQQMELRMQTDAVPPAKTDRKSVYDTVGTSCSCEMWLWYGSNSRDPKLVCADSLGLSKTYAVPGFLGTAVYASPQSSCATHHAFERNGHFELVLVRALVGEYDRFPPNDYKQAERDCIFGEEAGISGFAFHNNASQLYPQYIVACQRPVVGAHHGDRCSMCKDRSSAATVICRVRVDEKWSFEILDWDECRCGRNWGAVSKEDDSMLGQIDPTATESWTVGMRDLALRLPEVNRAAIPRTRIERMYISGSVKMPGGVHAVFFAYDI